MRNYIRAKLEGGYYFFTVVTYGRRRLFEKELARRVLREVMRETQGKRPYESIALCLLPDHLHCIWKLPEGDADFSTRWSAIKGRFTKVYLRSGGEQGCMTRSRSRKQEACVWQRRFWEHQIRDETDLQRHVDYVHYNPVKHGLVQRVEDWPWSTYHQYVRDGFYGPDRGFDEVIEAGGAGFGE